MLLVALPQQTPLPLNPHPQNENERMKVKNTETPKHPENQIPSRCAVLYCWWKTNSAETIKGASECLSLTSHLAVLFSISTFLTLPTVLIISAVRGLIGCGKEIEASLKHLRSPLHGAHRIVTHREVLLVHSGASKDAQTGVFPLRPISPHHSPLVTA